MYLGLLHFVIFSDISYIIGNNKCYITVISERCLTVMGLDINPPFLYKKIDSVHSLAVSAFQTSLQEAIATVKTVHFEVHQYILIFYDAF